jgi:D-alanyl-D-alanine carboxypeptidase
MFRGRPIHTHNRLLGQVKGVDGIKTGYTNASGFNLVTSVRRDRRHIVAVVLGGRTGQSRDAFMRKLIQDYIDDASTVVTAQPRSPAVVIDADLPTPPVRPADAAEASAKLAAATLEPASPVEVTHIGGDDEEAEGTTASVAVVDQPKPAPSVTPPPAAAERSAAARPAKGAIVMADASRDLVPSDPTAGMVRSGMPSVPGWFPYLLVAFIGCFGSLLSAFFTIVPVRFRRRSPQSA